MRLAKLDENIKSGLPGVRLLYLIILLVIVGLIFINVQLNFIWLRGFAQDLSVQAVDYELVQARRAAEVMEGVAGRTIESVNDLAHNLALNSLDSKKNTVLIQRFLKNNNYIRGISIIGLDGREKYYFSRGPSYREKKLKDVSFLEPFEKAKNNELFISRINYSKFAEPYVIISAPIKEIDFYNPVAVLWVSYYLRDMWEIALENKIGKTGRISVIDDKGMLIADPNPSRVLKKISLLDFPPAKNLVLGRRFEGAHYRNENNVEVIGVGVPFRVKDMNWGIIVEQDASEVEAPLREIIYWLIVVLLGNLIVIVVLVWLALIVKEVNGELMRRHKAVRVERKRVEDERNKAAAIVANFLDPIIVVDNEWRLSLLNPAAKKILKLSAQDVGRRLRVKNNQFSFEVFRDIVDLEFSVKKLAPNTGGYVFGEEVVIYPEHIERNRNPFSAGIIGYATGELIYRVMTTPVRDETGRRHGYMKIFYDLTRERMIDKMKSEFISIAAHQLRTPLSAIKWTIKMVLDGDAGKLTNEQADILDKGYKSNERMIALVNDMLNVSRIEEGRFGYSFELADFNKVVDESLEDFTSRIKAKNIKLNVSKSSKLPKVKIDKKKIILALENLLDNAIRYTPENGKIEIVLELDKKFLRFKIKDSGVGIPKKDQSKLFSKFFRAENVVRMQTEGSGLGLFIVKNIIEKHGGDITFTSREGRGTEFVFTLPLS